MSYRDKPLSQIHAGIRKEEAGMIADAQKFINSFKTRLSSYLKMNDGARITIEDPAYDFSSDFPLTFTLCVSFNIEGKSQTYKINFTGKKLNFDDWVLIPTGSAREVIFNMKKPAIQDSDAYDAVAGFIADVFRRKDTTKLSPVS